MGPRAALEAAQVSALGAETAEDIASAMAILRVAKRRAALAIALADIAGQWDLEEVTRVLTRFADACVSGALRFLLRDAAKRAGMDERSGAELEAGTGLVILAMGKYGAFELNYSSDIDLIVFYDAKRFPFRKKDDARGAAVDIVKGLVKLLQRDDRRRLCVPHRSAPAPRCGRDAGRDLHRRRRDPITKAWARTGSAPR